MLYRNNITNYTKEELKDLVENYYGYPLEEAHIIYNALSDGKPKN